MSFFEKMFEDQKDEREKVPVKKDYQENLNTIKEILNSCDDIVYREFFVKKDEKMKFAAIYTDGLVNIELLNEYVLENIMKLSTNDGMKLDTIKQKIYEVIKDGAIAVSDVKEIEDINEAIDGILAGDTILILDQWDKVLAISLKGWPMRGVSEPSTETVIRGSSDGFVETMRFNTALVRRRIKDPKLKIKQMKLGKRSKTDIAIMYIEDTVNKDILKDVKERLDKINIDAILESGYVEQLIEDEWKSPFPQIQNTQRPDVVAASLYEGRVVIIVDNTPFALLLPTTLVTLLQSPEDYSERFFIASLLRVMRFLSIIISLVLPSMYIAITSYHPGMLPTQLVLYVAGSRGTVPFPAFIETFIMEGALELLREAGLRLPGPIGGTIGIVGGLVLGQAAVEAGIVSPLMVIVVAITAMAANSAPNYSISVSFRILRFMLMIFSAMLGIYGVIIGIIIILIHLCKLKSFGVPYLSPFVASGMKIRNFKDVFIRVPLQMMGIRPQFLHRRDNTRLIWNKDDVKKEDGDSNGEK